MNLQQLRFVQEAVRQKLNLTEAAKSLHTSQPGVSKAILELEQELGVDIFTRRGKRLMRVTEVGEQVLQRIDKILSEVGNLKRLSEQYRVGNAGTLVIATTHTQARYVLPAPIAKLRAHYPNVHVSLHQGAPDQVAQMLLDEQAHIGIATESLADIAGLVTLPCYEWQHVMVVPRDHELVKKPLISLDDLAHFELITYSPAFAGRSKIDAAFEKARLTPHIVLEAIDSDVIKTYVRLGLGVGIAAEMAITDSHEKAQHADLIVKPLGHLFGQNVTRVAFKRGAYLRDFTYHFAELISPRLTRQNVTQAMQEAAPPSVR